MNKALNTLKGITQTSNETNWLCFDESFAGCLGNINTFLSNTFSQNIDNCSVAFSLLISIFVLAVLQLSLHSLCLVQLQDVCSVELTVVFVWAVYCLKVTFAHAILNFVLVFIHSMRPNYSIFMGYLRKNEIKSAKRTPQHLYTYEPPLKETWIYPCFLLPKRGNSTFLRHKMTGTHNTVIFG